MLDDSNGSAGGGYGGFNRGKLALGRAWHNWNGQYGGQPGEHYFYQSQWTGNTARMTQCNGWRASNDGYVDFVYIVHQTATGSTIPAQPLGLQPGTVGDETIQVLWTDQSFNESYFRVAESPSGQGNWIYTDLGANTTTWVDSPMNNGASYDYYVASCNNMGCSPWSNGISIVAGAASAPPTAPTNLTVTGISSSSISLAWTDNATNETSYTLWYLPPGGSWATLNLPANTTLYTHGGLSSGATYTYYVQACNAAGCSNLSNGVAATTTSSTPPLAPSNLYVSAVTGSSIALAWTDNATDETSYTLWYLPPGGSWATLTLAANTTFYTHSGLASGATYTYYTQACNTAGCSALSNGVQATTTSAGPPVAPTNLYITGVTSSSISMAWTDNATTEDRYQVWWLPPGGSWQITYLGANTTTWTQTGLPAGSTYTYYTQACNAAGCSALSNGVQATTSTSGSSIPNPPTNLYVYYADANNIGITWTNNSTNQTFFRVWWTPAVNITWTAIDLPANYYFWVHNGLPPNTGYYYYVQACNNAGCSALSNSTYGQTSGGFAPGMAGTSVPPPGPNSVPIRFASEPAGSPPAPPANLVRSPQRGADVAPPKDDPRSGPGRPADVKPPSAAITQGRPVVTPAPAPVQPAQQGQARPAQSPAPPPAQPY